jgi:hypothetical protein
MKGNGLNPESPFNYNGELHCLVEGKWPIFFTNNIIPYGPGMATFPCGTPMTNLTRVSDPLSLYDEATGFFRCPVDGVARLSISLTGQQANERFKINVFLTSSTLSKVDESVRSICVGSIYSTSDGCINDSGLILESSEKNRYRYYLQPSKTFYAHRYELSIIWEFG